MIQNKEIILPNGMHLESSCNHQRLWDKAVEHYSSRHNLWECPWCGGDIDNLCDERDQAANEFIDSWVCIGNCDLIITFTTPLDIKEYHDVMDSEWQIFLECSGAGYDWLAPDQSDDTEFSDILKWLESIRDQPITINNNEQTPSAYLPDVITFFDRGWLDRKETTCGYRYSIAPKGLIKIDELIGVINNNPEGKDHDLAHGAYPFFIPS